MKDYKGTGILLASGSITWGQIDREVMEFPFFDLPDFDTFERIGAIAISIKGLQNERTKILIPDVYPGLFNGFVNSLPASSRSRKRWIRPATSFRAIYQNIMMNKCGQSCLKSKTCKVPGCVCDNGICI